MNKIRLAFKLTMKHKINLMNAAIIDTLFILIFGFISSAYLYKIQEYLDAIGAIAVSAQGLGSDPTFSQIFINPLTAGYMFFVILLALLLMLNIYFIFSFLVGASTYVAFNIGHISIDELTKFLKRFFIISIPWILILSLNELVSLYFFFLDTIRPRFNLGNTYFGYFDIALLIFIGYFMMISFLLERKDNLRRSFSTGLKKFKKLFPVYLLMVVLIFLLSHPFIGEFIASLNYYLLLMYAVVIVVPCFTLARVVFKSYFEK
ncbi:hypothetical protein H6503_06375 [Candidatus Woesearchaeota archaeon]|nr:hypothetical protein [Candidatus Woesearchaeota archaeon]